MNLTNIDLDKYNAACEIVKRDDLKDLTLEQIVSALNKCSDFLFRHLLEKNVDMLVAIILALNDNYNSSNLGLLIKYDLTTQTPISIGSNFVRAAFNYECERLLKYHDFDLDILDIPCEDKECLQKYRDRSYKLKNDVCNH